MNLRFLFVILIAFTIKCIENVNPYQVLELKQGASQQEIRKQYKLLRKNSKDNQIKLQLYKDAYQQIMLDSTLQMTLPNQGAKPKQSSSRRNRRRRRGLPRLSDMFRKDYFGGSNEHNPQSSRQRAFIKQDQKNYAQQIVGEAGYRLPPEIDDPSFYKNQNRTEKILKDQNVAFNIKAAQYVLFLGGILLKLSPCICFYIIYRFRRKNGAAQQQINPFLKAANGWTGKNRKTFKKTK